MNYSSLPKIELHVHLDCSLSYDVVQKLNPGISYEAYRQTFVGPPKCTDLRDYLTRAVKGIELMQTEAALRLVTLDLFEQLQAERVIYAEIRFAPLEHLRGGLSAERVVQVVEEAVREGRGATGVIAGVILCTLRHYSEMQSMQTVCLAEQFAGTVVVGFDIAGDEAAFPVDNHIAAFQYARLKKIPCTAHAGEACGAESVWEILRHFSPQRIGHGVRSAEDPRLLDYLVKNNIHLEVCPTSNVQTNVYPAIADHRVDALWQAGISLSINTDARTISDTTLSDEYRMLHDVFGWSNKHFLKCNLDAIEHAFSTEEVKVKLRRQIMQVFTQL